MKSPSESQDTNNYYEFHRDHGHTTEGYFALKREIEALIERGFLGAYVSDEKYPMNNQNKDKAVGDRENQQPTSGPINIIIGGTT